MPSSKSVRKQLRKQSRSNWRPSPEREAREREEYERSMERENRMWASEAIDDSDRLLRKLRTFCESAARFPELAQIAESLRTLISPAPDEEWPDFLTGRWRELVLEASKHDAVREEASVVLQELAAFNETHLPNSEGTAPG